MSCSGHSTHPGISPSGRDASQPQTGGTALKACHQPGLGPVSFFSGKVIFFGWLSLVVAHVKHPSPPARDVSFGGDLKGSKHNVDNQLLCIDMRRRGVLLR